MRPVMLITSFAILLAGSANAQSPAFVRQFSPGSTHHINQVTSGSGAFVQQLPEEARATRATVQGRTSSYIERVFIEAFNRDAENVPPVIIYEDVGIASYGEAARPGLPAVGAGATVVLRGEQSAQSLPSIGAGAVILAAGVL